MKKLITLLLSLSMLSSSVGAVAFAEGEEASYKDGDLVWSEDFESFEDGDDFEANPTNGISLHNPGNGSSKVKEATTGNKYLYMQNETNSGSYILKVPAGKAAKGDDSLFTVDVEIKLDDTGSTAMEWNFGLGNLSAQYLNGAYVTVNPSKLDNSGRMTKYGNSDFAVNGTRSVAKTFKQTIPGEDIIGNYSRLHANAWNTYRFITRKDENGNYYADLYINGAYFYQVGVRTDNKYAGGAQNCFLFTVPKAAIKPGVSIDNIKFYYGAVESNEYVTKGEFTLDRYTFDECAVGVNRYEGSENSAITFVGEDANHAFGVMRRYNAWNMNLDIESGKAGKSESDNSLSVHSGGRVAFANVNNDQGGNTAAYSTKYGTWVPEGDSLEFSADVLFKDIDENWLFQLESAIKDDYQDIAIEITPNFYSLGDWEGVDDFKNNRQRIAPKLPLNTWVNIRVIITRGTNDTFNKITIYADDNVICENQDITTWYTATNTTTDDGKTVVVYGEPRKGDILSKGLGKIYFHGECDYDNITIKKYLLGQEFTKPSSVPVLVNPTTKVDEYPSLRGKVYTDGRSIQSVIDAFGITGDYVVRDADGKEVTDYTKVADGNYIEFFANGKKYYGAFVANNVVETINETAGDLGGFTFDEAVVSVEAVTKGQGRDANDTSIQLTNNSEDEAIDDTQRFIKALNTDENAYMEFSFLADENTDFYVGYNVYYVINGNTAGYDTKQGAHRSYYDHIHIADNEVRSTNGDNGKRLVGTYKDGEWTKVRLEWNSMNNNAVAVSVNDSKKVLLNAGPVSYFKTIRNITITPAANTSVVLDDVLVMEGYKAAPEAAAVIDVTADYVYNKENKLSVPFEMGNSFMIMDALASSIEVSPAGSSKKWIKADGSKAEERTDEVDKLVLVNDGVYTYYPVVVREGITEFKNADGTSMMVIDVTNENIADLSGSKLISAVYDKESGKLVSAVMNDITFAEDSYTGEVNIMPQNYDAETQTMKYFAWKLSDMMSLCDALEYSK